VREGEQAVRRLVGKVLEAYHLFGPNENSSQTVVIFVTDEEAAGAVEWLSTCPNGDKT
jgi:hypothetical protein